MKELNIEKGFVKFQTAANKGYQLTKSKCDAISAALLKAERNIKIASGDQNPFKVIQNNAINTRQNAKFQILKTILEEIQQDIEKRHEGSNNFSIAVYGRKMAGKSTLMETLTHGDGKTIGKGTDRTIKEIRTYYWNGFKITDISGVDFFSNTINDVLKEANVILFLMTNDAPQAEEAECFAKLKSLGKPILGIINVRKILNFKKRDVLLQDLKKILPNTKEIENLIANFKNFAPQYNQDWSNIKFMPVHLLAAYYSRMERINDEEIYNASNFVEIENLILGKVITHGEFLQVKKFIDTAAIPIYHMFSETFDYSARCFIESNIWKEQAKKILAWRKTFSDNAQIQFNKLTERLSENLKKEIPQFVDSNSGAENVNQIWNEKIIEFGLIERYQDLFKNLLIQCKVEFLTLINSLMQEFNNSLGDRIQNDIKTINAQLFGEYSDTVFPTLSDLMPNMEWAGISNSSNDAGAMFYQAFFEASATPRVSKEMLKDQLKRSSFSVLEDIKEITREILNKQIFDKIDEVAKTAENYSYVMVKIGEAQGEIAEMLLGEYEGLNSELLTEAAKCLGIKKLSGIKVTFRIPGERFGVVAENFSIDIEKISKVLNEKFSIMTPEKSWYNTMKKMLKCEFEFDEYSIGVKSDNKTYSVTPKGKVSAERLKLAQQISPYPIITL